MSIHIGAERGDIAEIVLLPGDPLRAEYAATTFLEGAVCYNKVRGMLGFTGTWKGTRVSIQGTGMGIPSHSIYVTELINDFGAKTLLRIGSCGSVQEEVRLRDLVIAMAASTDSAHNQVRFPGIDFAPVADGDLFIEACRRADERKLCYHAGGIFSGDAFYNEVPDSWKAWARFGVLAIEMETSGLYTIAAKAGARALSICTVSDSIITGEALSSKDRQTSFSEMIELALDTAVGA